MKAFIEWLLSLFAPKSEPKQAETVQRISDDAIRLLQAFEGLRLRAYKDAVGVLTIGFGDTENVTPGMVITKDEAIARLKKRIAREFEPGVRKALARTPTQHEFDAMVSLAYNIGVSAFSKSTLVKKFNAGDLHGAADEFLRWKLAGGRILAGLLRRRRTERALFLGAGIDTALKIWSGA